ncbi:hypothetical protein [Aquipuribacter sp. MA13-6]|uniref:hypothetical protein n=1 Tax=unclassified Aquipuribacter TaxID=2635084 RepID=UPI003EE8660D
MSGYGQERGRRGRPEHARSASGSVPPGWPRSVPPPGTPGFVDRAVGWLLDVCPPEYREHPVLLKHPPVLAWLAARHVAAQVEAGTVALAQARADLASRGVDGRTVEEVLEVLHSESTRLRAAARGCELLAGALQGSRWVPRL